MNKTNAMRLLDAAKIKYEVCEYEVDENNLAGTHVAEQIGLPCEMVFKTLVTRGDKTGITVFCIPADKEIDLKAAAIATGNKSIVMMHCNELLANTGYIRGGVSPIGMKKRYPTVVHSSALSQPTVVLSAGKIGEQIELSPDDLKKATGCEFAEIAR